MARFNKQKLIKDAKKKGIILQGKPVRFTGTQRIYDFDVSGDTNVKRIKIAYFSDEKTVKNCANVYLKKSKKQGICYTSYNDLINKVKESR
jgi:hypothetical protein